MKLLTRPLNVRFFVNKHRPPLKKFTQPPSFAFKRKYSPLHYVFPEFSNTLFIVCVARY